MAVATITISILVITFAVRLFNKFSPLKICSICAGVAGTWLWMLIGMLTGQLPVASYQLPAAILIGGSVVGIAYQVEKFLPGLAGWRTPLLWKALFIPGGFIAASFLLSFKWLEFLIVSGILLVIMSLFLQSLKKPEESSRNEVDLGENKEKRIEMLEEEMEECC